MKRSVLTLGILAALFLSCPLQAQTFSSGSTGADGALDLSSGDQTLQLPPSGVFNFTTVNVPAGRTLRFLANSSNTPVIILAQGNVTISGEVSVSALNNTPPNFNRLPGPGGFLGGFQNADGFGPGAGQISGDVDGHWVGALSLVPIIGGSGSAGPNILFNCSTNGGGGGGGAIVIASSTTMILGEALSNGMIDANGAFNYCRTSHGAGGAIRLVANGIVVRNGITLSAQGRDAPHHGVIRLEAPAIDFAGSSFPAAVLSTTINPTIVPSTGTPRLTIASIGGFSVPSGAGSRPDTVDLLLPTQLSDPIPLIVQSSNIPVGSQVTLAVNGSPSASVAPVALTGTDLSGTATLNITGLDRSKVIFLFASVTFDVPTIARADSPLGPDHVAKLRVDAIPGNEPRVAFLRGDGTEVDLNRVPARLKQRFGQ